MEWFSLPVPKALRNASALKTTFKYIQAEDSYFKGRDIYKSSWKCFPCGIVYENHIYEFQIFRNSDISVHFPAEMKTLVHLKFQQQSKAFLKTSPSTGRELLIPEKPEGNPGGNPKC